ncbi:tyrosine-type recombinase/integrase [Lentzea sp. HUAS12]|uniref:tyrosine-type recombinase/integrase n=1 Tax=Lentzea sp. HUAS12 TaxID=2951806 RepID=UPI0020A0ECD9|nr:tyrosine-type recombinase/integrase [Lentzea sp. HUAS12]USX56399.1 site-specific integrase [Lentzea sp. HUAS12]
MAWPEKSGKNSWRVRYEKDDGSLASVSGFTSEAAAQEVADRLNREAAVRGFVPTASTQPFGGWIEPWFGSIDVAESTLAQYRSLTRNHIEPRWGVVPFNAISNLDAHTWAVRLRNGGLSDSTVKTIMKILKMMLADAADEGIIPTSPIHARRRGRRRHQLKPDIVHATPLQVLRIALQAASLMGEWAAILIISAAYTGARWGELTGLQRHNIHLDDGCFVIDPRIGALHEVDGKLSLGQPKTASSARTVTLPPFLCDIWGYLLDQHDHPHIFVTRDLELHRRSNFSRRVMRPACDGNYGVANPRVRTRTICPDLVFHGLRHSHNTWLIGDDIPEVGRARRLGHQIHDKIREIYDHVAPEVEAKILIVLQRRWEDSLATQFPNGLNFPDAAPMPALAAA